MIFEQLVAQPLYGDGKFFFGEDCLQSEYFYKNNKTLMLLLKKDIHSR